MYITTQSPPRDVAGAWPASDEPLVPFFAMNIDQVFDSGRGISEGDFYLELVGRGEAADMLVRLAGM